MREDLLEREIFIYYLTSKDMIYLLKKNALSVLEYL